jgi:Trypsin-like peptidase domain
VNDDDWKHAIAAVIDGKNVIRGTAFFVGPDVALTCNHVLVAASEGPIYLKSVGSTGKEKVLAQDCDEELDLALVQVASKPDRKKLALRHDTPSVGSRLYSYGFPRNRKPADFPDGFPMKPAEVSGQTTLLWRGQPVELLVLVGADATSGMSGAPALYEESDTVAGILRFIEGGQQNVFAIPAATAVKRWPGLLTEPGRLAPSFTELTALVIAESLASTAWNEFDPALLHCVVVGSEPSVLHESEGSLADLVAETFSSQEAITIWESFARAWEDRLLVRTGEARRIAKEYKRSNVRFASFNVVDAYASPESLDLAVRLIVEADLALFDVTHFQPGVMFLLGIRAATRRAVTINSHGAGWREGEPISRPFNLADLSLASHTPPTDLVGEDPRLERLVKRVSAGFDQYSRQPSYQDLPVYDELRKLGPREDAWASIPLERGEVLVLCSYGSKYFPTWQRLRRQVKDALSQLSVLTNVTRLQDVATPQLVSQSLYERVRRCSGCIADWTLSSPSTFFELGVRIAVSPWGVVQIADEQWFQEASTSIAIGGDISQQLVRMGALLNPLFYKTNDTEIGARIARQLVELRDRIAGSGGHHLRQVAAEALRATEERFPDLFWQLTRDADAFSHQRSVRDNIPQTLYYEVREIKADQERAALERRVGAWLYLEHRLGAGDLDESDSRKRLWRELGELAAYGLFLSSDEADQSLALLITERLS